MTIARDKEGHVIGQVLATGYAYTEDGRATGPLLVKVLGRDGTAQVPLASVRLEEISDR